MSKRRFINAVTNMFDGKITLEKRVPDVFTIKLINDGLETTRVSLSNSGMESIKDLANRLNLSVTFGYNFTQISIKEKSS